MAEEIRNGIMMLTGVPQTAVGWLVFDVLIIIFIFVIMFVIMFGAWYVLMMRLLD